MAYPHTKHMIVFNDDFSHQKADQPQQFNFNRKSITIDDDDEDMILESMIHNNKIECLYEIFKSEEPEQIEVKPISPRKEKKKKKTKTSEPQLVALFENPKTVETLLEYLKPESLDRIRLDFEEIYTSVFKRLKPFAAYVLENKGRIEEIIDTFISRMILLLLPQDKQGIKLEKIMRDIDKMHHIRDKLHIQSGKNDFENYDEVNLMRSERGKASLFPETDPIAIKFSAKRKRGRRNKTSSEARLNELESLNGDYITPKKGTSKTGSNEDTLTGDSLRMEVDDTEEEEDSGQKSDTIDYHPIFTQILVTLNKSLPKVNNHGWFIYNIMRGIRELDSKEWPLCELMKVANNMQYCIRAERITLPVYDENEKRHYCAFSGLPLHSGEVVTLVKMVEISAVRYLKEPEEEKILIDRTFESPEFKESIRCFYMKTEICCPTAINYTDFDEEYKTLFPSHFGLSSKKKTTTKPKKEVKVEVEEEDEEEKIKEKKKRKLTDSKKEIPLEFNVIKEKTKKKKPKDFKKSANKTTIKIDCTDEPLIVTSERFRSEREVWHLMLPLHKKLSTSWERTTAFHNVSKETYKKNYANERSDLFKIFENVKDTNFRAYFDKLLLYCIKTSEPYPKEVDESVLVSMLFNVILDFVNALFEIPKVSKSKEENPVIRNLFLLCKERQNTEFSDNRAIFKPKKRPHIFNHYPFLFLILFDYLMEKKQFELVSQDWKDFAYNPVVPVESDRLFKRLNIGFVV